MNTIDLYEILTPEDQVLATIYFASGVLFLVFMYLILYCQFVYKLIRWAIGTLMFSIGFMFLSTAGKMVQGTDYNLIKLTQWAVILCTLAASWVVYEFLKWNRKKQKEKEQE